MNRGPMTHSYLVVPLINLYGKIDNLSVEFYSWTLCILWVMLCKDFNSCHHHPHQLLLSLSPLPPHICTNMQTQISLNWLVCLGFLVAIIGCLKPINLTLSGREFQMFGHLWVKKLRLTSEFYISGSITFKYPVIPLIFPSRESILSLVGFSCSSSLSSSCTFLKIVSPLTLFSSSVVKQVPSVILSKYNANCIKHNNPYSYFFKLGVTKIDYWKSAC